MGTVVAIALTIQMCMAGPVPANQVCDDGSQPFIATMNIMSGATADDCPYTWETVRRCVYAWDSVLSLERDGRVLFRLKPDGSSEIGEGFTSRCCRSGVHAVGRIALLDQNVLNKK